MRMSSSLKRPAVSNSYRRVPPADRVLIVLGSNRVDAAPISGLCLGTGRTENTIRASSSPGNEERLHARRLLPLHVL